jgi:hypothetical protein
MRWASSPLRSTRWATTRFKPRMGSWRKNLLLVIVGICCYTWLATFAATGSVLWIDSPLIAVELKLRKSSKTDTATAAPVSRQTEYSDDMFAYLKPDERSHKVYNYTTHVCAVGGLPSRNEQQLPQRTVMRGALSCLLTIVRQFIMIAAAMKFDGWRTL